MKKTFLFCTSGSMIGLFLLLSSFNFISPQPKDKIKLGLNLKKDQELKMSNIINQDIRQSVMGTENSFNQQIGMYYTLRVKDIVGENYLMDILYTRTTFKTDNPTAAVDFDSDLHKKDIPPTALGYAAIVDQGFGLEMSPDGKVLKIIGMEDFSEGMAQKLLELNPELGALMAETVKTQFDEMKLERDIENMTMYLPPHEVEVGDSWKSGYEMKQLMEMKLANTFTLDKVEKDKAYISMKSELTTNKDQEVEMQGMKMKYDLSGEQTGEFVVDMKSGWILEAQVIQDIAGDMSIDSPQLPEPLNVPMSIKSEVGTLSIN